MNKFLFGVATAAYQIEGTHKKFDTIWDHHEDLISDHSNCDVACDFYHRYEEDIKYIERLGVDVYRMSISWARVQPKENAFSLEGINFYKRVIKSLKDKNIKVDLTLYHWDMPQWLLDKGIGFDHPMIVSYFLAYAKKMFECFDDDARAWTTLNEPWCVSVVGYLYGSHAPFVKNMTSMAKAQYHTLLIHDAVYTYYKMHYDKPIGIVYNLWKQYPLTHNELNIEALKNSIMFHSGIYLDPLFKGKYPDTWVDTLESFGVDTSFINHEKIREMKDHTDYLGINYYAHQTVVYDDQAMLKFKHIHTGYDKTEMDWEIYADGLIDLIKDLRSDYTNIPVIITENGAAFNDELKDGKVHDTRRTQYILDHVNAVLSHKEELNIQGYYVWSLLDNFEWAFGYTKRFGIIYVDFDSLERYPKDSYYAYKEVIKKNK